MYLGPSPTWELLVEFQAPGFCLAQPSLLQLFGEMNQREWGNSVFQVSYCQIMSSRVDRNQKLDDLSF